MKSYIALLAAILLLAGCQSSKTVFQPVLPMGEDFQSVLLLKNPSGHFASGFLHIRNGKLYIITARHFAAYMSQKDSMSIFFDGQWNTMAMRLVGHAPGDIDISVVSFAQPFQQESFKPTAMMSANDTIEIGCEVWYLGFPLGFMHNDSDRRYPYPLLKHAYLSTVAPEPRLFYFDGVCNPGFSGGPVYARATDGGLRLIGVVSNRFDETEGQDTRTNAGIFAAYSANYADLLIDQNPVGTTLQ